MSRNYQQSEEFRRQEQTMHGPNHEQRPLIRKTFTTPYEQHADRVGQPFTVKRKITKPEKDYDADALPMYEITFSDGVTIPAWPEEVEE